MISIIDTSSVSVRSYQNHIEAGLRASLMLLRSSLAWICGRLSACTSTRPSFGVKISWSRAALRTQAECVIHLKSSPSCCPYTGSRRPRKKRLIQLCGTSKYTLKSSCSSLATPAPQNRSRKVSELLANYQHFNMDSFRPDSV